MLGRFLLKTRPWVLALGGGGARGFAHIGVLAGLEERGVRIRGLAGTSMGALVAAMYLVYGSAQAVHDKWLEAFRRNLLIEVPQTDFGGGENARDNLLLQAARRFRDRIIISIAMNRSSIVQAEDLQRAIDLLIPDIRIEDLASPLVVVACDLETGREVRLDRGPLRPAVQASSAIPGLVPTVSYNGQRLMDGAAVAEVPVHAAATLGRPVVAVNVSQELPPVSPYPMVIHAIRREQQITSKHLLRHHLRAADLTIRPEVHSATWADWDRFETFVDLGRRSVARALGSDPVR